MLHQVAAHAQTLHGRPAQAQCRAAVTCSAWTGVRPARLSPAVPRRCGPAAAQLLAARRAGVAVSALGKPDAEEQPKLTRKQEPDECVALDAWPVRPAVSVQARAN